MKNPLKKKSPYLGKEVSDWEQIFDSPLPKIAALFGLATGGSHFVMHKLHSHEQILGLNERVLYRELKHYLRFGSYPIQKLIDGQLRPKKDNFKNVAWIILNKAQMAHVSYQYLFNRQRIRSIYCFRNPVSLYFSREKSRIPVGETYYGRKASWKDIAESIALDYKVSIASFAQAYDPQLDTAVNLESFVAQLDENLSNMWKKLAVIPVSSNELSVLTNCDICGRPLEKKSADVSGRKEEVLYCKKDDMIYTGPGGYNYIRKVAPERLAAWKNREFAEEVSRFFSDQFGAGLMDYFENEAYLAPNSHTDFLQIFENLIDGFQLRLK